MHLNHASDYSKNIFKIFWSSPSQERELNPVLAPWKDLHSLPVSLIKQSQTMFIPLTFIGKRYFSSSNAVTAHFSAYPGLMEYPSFARGSRSTLPPGTTLTTMLTWRRAQNSRYHFCSFSWMRYTYLFCSCIFILLAVKMWLIILTKRGDLDFAGRLALWNARAIVGHSSSGLRRVRKIVFFLKH